MQRSTTLTTFIAILAASALSACAKKAEAPAEVAAPPPPPAAEPAPAPKLATFLAFKIGELDAVSLRDGAMELPNDNKVFGLGKTPEDVAAVLSAAGQPTDKLALTIEPLLVKAKDHVLLFDTGAGALFGPGSGQLPHSLADAGVDPQSVTDIFISHSHGDHVSGLVNAEGALAFPNATIHLSKAEWAHMSKQDEYKPMIAALKPKVTAFAAGAELVPGVVKAVDIKGHTPGHSGYLITSGADTLLYVGDSMHHFVISVQKPEWTMAYDGDQPTAAASRAALIADSASKGQRIYAVHFPFPGLGKFAKQGEGYVWVAE